MAMKFSKQDSTLALPLPNPTSYFKRTVWILEKLRYVAAFVVVFLICYQVQISLGLKESYTKASQAAARVQTFRLSSYATLVWLVTGVTFHLFWMAWRSLPLYWEGRKTSWNDYRAKMLRKLKNVVVEEKESDKRVDAILKEYQAELRTERLMEYGCHALLLVVCFVTVVAFNHLWAFLNAEFDLETLITNDLSLTTAVFIVPFLLGFALIILFCFSFVFYTKSYIAGK